MDCIIVIPSEHLSQINYDLTLFVLASSLLGDCLSERSSACPPPKNTDDFWSSHVNALYPTSNLEINRFYPHEPSNYLVLKFAALAYYPA